MPPRRSMETNPINFGDFFDAEARYIVPRFQRDYNWGKDQVEEFWDDLWKHWTDWKNHRAERVPYYFGSLMLVNEDEREMVFRIVDGQQRMTTALIFFIALRDYYVETGDEGEVEALNEIIYYEDEDEELKPRLQLNRYNDPYFSTKMVEEKKTSEKMNSIGRDIRVKDKELANCYKQFSRKFLDEEGNVFGGGITVEEKQDELRDMYGHLLKNFEVVENIFSSKQRAYRIFETINHKGLRLDENDLVKNYLMELIDDTNSVEEPQDVINADDKWGDIVSTLEHIRVKEDTFLRWHLTAFVGKTPKLKIYDRIVENVTDKQGALQFLDDLERSVDFISRVKKPTKEEWHDDDEIVENLTGLDAISDGGFYPILLAGSHDKFNDGEMKKLIELVVKLHFRAKTVCSVSFTEIEGLVVKVCSEIKRNTSYFLPEVINEMVAWSKYPSNDEFELKFKQLELNSSAKARYVLSQIEYSMAGGRSTQSWHIDPDIQIEHIMPKSIEGDWFNELQARSELNTAAEINDYHKRNLNKLGNLTLISPRANAIIQNDAYRKKLNGTGAYDGYRSDMAKMTSRLVDYQEWGQEQIEIRQGVFLLQAKNIWDLQNNN